MQGKPVVWFELYVKDMARAQAFYEKLLDVTLEPLDSPDPGYRMMVFPGAMEQGGQGVSGALVEQADGPSPGAGGTMVYFGGEDCAVPAGRAAALGGRLVQDKMSIGPYGFCAVVEDPDGNRVGLHSMA
ncbi:MAG: VOC family protein [Pseudoxanthomonas sp.]|nr:VOC family protein [Pseudoxanthomonas sp.]